ncbi:hypothetical protein L211DRAFT_853528 [Terfezia boudieri ATCC MYA-4762]|uniref:Uncharacterized protein n=1 Tax=Terfezia boudieri ATCC MYA-4762 TaxID=1051890 RepID=A0A3N4L8X2_9PEZI|nr:hypothetical protein L211DRAFT_853528 [Terfezia boudieri ATCC MYA-4762]
MGGMQQQHESLMPTARSPALLLQLFTAYPILKSILSYRHRCEIINLARTCRFLHRTITEAISTLPNAFPSCTRCGYSCYVCNTPVCNVCSQYVKRQLTPSEKLGFHGYEYAIVGRNQTSSTRVVPCDVRWLTSGSKLFGWAATTIICEACFRAPQALEGTPVQRDWILLLPLAPLNAHLYIKNLYPQCKWDDIPNADSACICPNFGAGCDALPHLVGIERVPTLCWQLGVARDDNFSAGYRSSMVIHGGRFSPHVDNDGVLSMPFFLIN